VDILVGEWWLVVGEAWWRAAFRGVELAAPAGKRECNADELQQQTQQQVGLDGLEEFRALWATCGGIAAVIKTDACSRQQW